MNMSPSPWLYNFLKQYERFRPTAYLPTPKDVPTIGWGHTKGAKLGDTCTSDQAQAWLEQDVAGAVASCNRLIHVPLNQCQFDALCSLMFNCGTAPLVGTLGSLLNAKDYAGAAQQFKRWDRQAGKELPGLENRRIAEMNHFLTPDANA